MSNLSSEARLEKLLAQSAKGQPFYPFAQDERFTLQQVDLDPAADLHAHELRISNQIEKIAKNAIKERLGYKPPKIKSHVTEQMVKKYQLSLLQPVVINGEKFKYHPSSITLDKVEYPDRPVILTESQKANVQGEINGLVIAIGRRKALQVDMRRQLEQNRRDFDAAMGANQVRKFKGKPQRNETPIQFDIRKAAEKNAEAERVRDEADRLRRIFSETEVELELQIAQSDEEITRFETEIRRFRVSIDESVTNEADYLAAVQQIDSENAQRIDAYKADMNRLNRGAFNLTKEPDETEDEFRQRLIETGQTTWDPADVEQATATYFRSILREKLLELTRDYGLIGETLKFLTDEEVGEVEINFPTIKDKFLKQFGFDNQSLTVRDMGMFLRKIVTPIIKEKNEGGAGVLIEEAKVVEGPTDVTMTEAKFDGFSVTGLRNWLEARKNVAPFNELLDDGETTYDKLVRDFERARRRKEDVKDLFRRAGIIVDAPEGVFGRGMKAIKHELPNLIEFGKVKISPRKLYYNNTLVIKHKTGNSLSGIPNTRVSDKFSDIVLGLLQDRQPTVSDFKALDLNEKALYDSLIRVAGLHKMIENNFDETKHQMKNRLELLEGEIGAGNNNPAIKKEMHGLVNKMAACGMVGYNDGRKYLKSMFK